MLKLASFTGSPNNKRRAKAKGARLSLPKITLATPYKLSINEAAMSSANYKSNSIFAFFAKAGGAGAALGTTMILARMLSTEDFASFVIAYMVVTLGSFLGPLGMGSAILRYAGAFLGAGHSEEARRVTRRCIAMGVVGLLVVAGLLLPFHSIIQSQLSSWPKAWIGTALVSAWLVGAGLLLLLTSGLRAYGKIVLGTLAEVTVPRLMILASMTLLYVTGVTSLLVVLAVMAGIMLLTAVWSAVELWATLPSSEGGDAEEIPRKKIARFAFPILGSNVLFQATTDATILAVAYFCNAKEVAIYGAAYRIWGVFGLPQSAVAGAIQGRIAELHAAKDARGLESLVRHSANLAMWPTLLITAVVCLAAGPILHLLFGEFYAGGAHVLVILSLAQFLFVALGPSEHLMAMTGRQSTVLYASLASVISAALLAWGFTPVFGLTGAAAAAGVSIVLFKLILSWQAWREFGLWTGIGLPISQEPSSEEASPLFAMKSVVK